MGIIFENGFEIGTSPELATSALLIENGNILAMENGNILLFD
jgi:hypothetical protein